MRRRLLVALLVLVPALPAGADDAGKDAERAKKIEVAKAAEEKDRAAFQARVNDAIDKGVAWLKTRRKSTTGGFPGRPGTVPGRMRRPESLQRWRSSFHV